MRLRIAAVGRLSQRSPEAALIDDYLTRFGQTGRALGLGPASVAEVDATRIRALADEKIELPA